MSLYLDRQHGRFDNASLQALLASTHRLDGVDQQVAAFRFVLVSWELWTCQEL